MNSLLLYLTFVTCFSLSACYENQPLTEIKKCSLHGIELVKVSGFFAQDGSAKPSRDLRPLLNESDKLYPFMTPWHFNPFMDDTYPSAGIALICFECNKAISTKLGRNYPEYLAEQDGAPNP